MISQRMPAILTVIIISIGAQTALGAGGDNNYASAAQKPTGYNKAVALIAAEKYQEAILPLQSAEKMAQNDADIQNLLGFAHRKTGKLDAAGGYYQRALEIDPKHKPKQSINKISEYTIERVERLSGAFEQGKVFVSIDQSLSYESQLQLCKYLANRYNEFSSIVICLYANNQVGKNLAKGINEFVSVSQQKQFWLAFRQAPE